MYNNGKQTKLLTPSLPLKKHKNAQKDWKHFAQKEFRFSDPDPARKLMI